MQKNWCTVSSEVNFQKEIIPPVYVHPPFINVQNYDIS